jgi:hypothetical protein
MKVPYECRLIGYTLARSREERGECTELPHGGMILRLTEVEAFPSTRSGDSNSENTPTPINASG